MKKFKSVLSILITILVFAACIVVISIGVSYVMNNVRKVSFAETNISRLTNNGYIDLYKDNDTNVLYVRTETGTLTVMVNADGTPKIWHKTE